MIMSMVVNRRYDIMNLLEISDEEMKAFSYTSQHEFTEIVKISCLFCKQCSFLFTGGILIDWLRS